MTKRGGHGGRPKLRDADPGEKVTMSVRITQEMKTRLEELATATGRSQSQEAEIRLARSFEREDLLPEVLTLAYGRESAGLLMAIGLIMKVVGDEFHVRDLSFDGAQPWTDNAVAFGNVAHTILVLLDAAKPGDQAVDPEIGIRAATGLISALKNPVKKGWFIANHHVAKPIRSLLGHTMDRMSKASGRQRLPVLDSDTQARQYQISAAARAVRMFLAMIEETPDSTIADLLRRPTSQEFFEVLEKGLTGSPDRGEIIEIANRYKSRVSRINAEEKP